MSDNIVNGPILDEVVVTAKDLSKKDRLYVPSIPEVGKITPLPDNPQNAYNALVGRKSMKNSNGFYYDKQLENELITVSLHVNTETDDGGVTWRAASGAKDGIGWGGGYQIEPIFRALLSEDYQTAISNSWSEFGADAVGELINSFKPYTPYLNRFAELLDEMNMVEEEKKASGDKVMDSKIVKGLDFLTDALRKGIGEGPKLGNRQFIAQGARFSYYSGTGVGFGNLTMKFTVFSDYDENGVFHSADSKLQKLYPYCFGKFVKLLETKTEENGQTKGYVTGTDIGTPNFVSSHSDLVNKFFGWQLPPGGFESEVKDIDLCQKGTMKLKFGAFYALDNLVVSNAQFNFSKQMVKSWDQGSGGNDINPLFCDVTLTFKPASKFTDNKLYEFVSGKTMEQERTSMESKLQDNLIDKKYELSNYLDGIGEAH